MKTIKTSIASLAELKQQLNQIQKSISNKKVLVGFDGFIDRIKKAVKQKRNSGTTYFETMKEFADRISEASGQSSQFEMDVQLIKLGGNAPILSNSLGKLGVHSICIGSLGYPVKHPTFTMDEKCEVINTLNPGFSDAIEFSDGKIIFSELSVFDEYNWAYVKKIIGLGKLKKLVSDSALLAFVDWVNLPHASDLWEGVLHDVIKPSGRKDFLFLFDLCDPSKKTTEQIDEVIDLIGCFSHYGKVTLGLNENEAMKIWAALRGVDLSDAKRKEKIPSIVEVGDFLYKQMNIDCVLIHPTNRTIAFHQREIIEMKGHYVTNPRVQTGGGDNLNAGYCFGLLHGLSMPQCMLLGMAASGSYVQNGCSSTPGDLIKYIEQWIASLENKSELKLNTLNDKKSRQKTNVIEKVSP